MLYMFRGKGIDKFYKKIVSGIEYIFKYKWGDVRGFF